MSPIGESQNSEKKETARFTCLYSKLDFTQKIKIKRKKKIKTKKITPTFYSEVYGSDLYNINYQDEDEVSAKHQTYSEFNTIKINLKSGIGMIAVKWEDIGQVYYNIKCEKTTLSAKKIAI